MLLNPISEHNAIRGNIIYIDSYKNAIINIRKEEFTKAAAGRTKYVIYLRRAEYNIHEIGYNYDNVPPGEKVAFFNAAGYLEIGINQGKAAELLGLKTNDMVRIEFFS